jgi:hypothetical protein
MIAKAIRTRPKIATPAASAHQRCPHESGRQAMPMTIAMSKNKTTFTFPRFAGRKPEAAIARKALDKKLNAKMLSSKKAHLREPENCKDAFGTLDIS